MKQTSRNILAVCMLHAADREPVDCKRRHGRVRIQAVRCSKGAIEDLSATGMKICSRRLMKPCEKPHVFTIDTGDETIRVAGRVMWAAKGSHGRKTAGIEFVGIDESQRRMLSMLARTAAANSQMFSRIYDRAS